jgi:hypothetical protein
MVNSTILTPLSIPWSIDETCLVYWGHPWTNSWIHCLPQSADNQTHIHVHSLKQNTIVPTQLYISNIFSMCDSKLIMCMSRSICMVSNMLMKAWICATIDALLGPGVNPLEGSPNVKLRKVGTEGTLPVSNSRKG